MEVIVIKSEYTKSSERQHIKAIADLFNNRLIYFLTFFVIFQVRTCILAYR